MASDQTTAKREYTREEMRDACLTNYKAGLQEARLQAMTDQNQTTAPSTDFELVMGAAKRLAEDFEDPCDRMPPCAEDDWNCACIRRSKLALGIEGNFTETWDEIYGS